jgi:Carboxypeptidase regulatory-like domain
MSLRCHRVYWLAILLFSGLPYAASPAQTFTGAVVGRVFDSQQAVIVKAAVILRNIDRGFQWHTTTETKGEYFFPLVPPGKFTVQAQASGFAIATVNVEVVVATQVRADLVLSVEPLQQAFEVFGEKGVAVQTENAALGPTISQFIARGDFFPAGGFERNIQRKISLSLSP